MVLFLVRGDGEEEGIEEEELEEEVVEEEDDDCLLVSDFFVFFQYEGMRGLLMPPVPPPSFLPVTAFLVLVLLPPLVLGGWTMENETEEYPASMVSFKRESVAFICTEIWALRFCSSVMSQEKDSESSSNVPSSAVQGVKEPE